MIPRVLPVVLFYAMTQVGWCLDRAPDDLLCRVVDVGAGECCVIVIPGNHYLVFDGGNYKDGGSTAMNAVEELIPEGSTIDLMVISHSDADHLAAIDDILDAYHVKTILHTGDKRTTDSWIAADAAVRNAEENFGTENLNLKTASVDFGKQFSLGDATVTFVAGWHKAPAEFGALNPAEAKNAISIVVRVEYRGKSILLTGDSVGRHIDDPASTCIAAEKFMVDNAASVPIQSSVLIAAHHGADNGSSIPFIQAVNPRYVVFSAGHAFQHPRQVTAGRFLNFGLSSNSIFRTDRGDDEGLKEWDHLRIPGHVDPAGDDDVDVLIRGNGEIRVDYRYPESEGAFRELMASAPRRGNDMFIASELSQRLMQVDSPTSRRTVPSPSSNPPATDLDRTLDRVLRQIEELKDEVRRCKEEKPKGEFQHDPINTVKQILDVIRAERKADVAQTPRECSVQVEWDAILSALISFIVTALGSSTIFAKFRIQRLETENRNAMKSVAVETPVSNVSTTSLP